MSLIYRPIFRVNGWGNSVLAEKGILEYVRMQDCKENWLHAVFKYASADQI
jgi:hypothetical protein